MSAPASRRPWPRPWPTVCAWRSRCSARPIPEVARPALIVAGGVAANLKLRSVFEEAAAAHGFDLIVPPAALCTDNAAMIAWAGAERLALGSDRRSGRCRAGPLAAGPDAVARLWRGQAGGQGMSRKFGIVGAGAWGTALAHVARSAGHAVGTVVARYA